MYLINRQLNREQHYLIFFLLKPTNERVAELSQLCFNREITKLCWTEALSELCTCGTEQ